MITVDMIRDKLTYYNRLIHADLSLFHYNNPASPYGLMLDGSLIVRGNKHEIYYYLDGAVTAIFTYAHARNLPITVDSALTKP